MADDERRADIEAVARAIHHATPVALRRSHPDEYRLLEWDEEPEWARDVFRHMAVAADRVRDARGDDEGRGPYDFPGPPDLPPVPDDARSPQDEDHEAA